MDLSDPPQRIYRADVSVREIVELYEYRKLLECHTVEQVAEIGVCGRPGRHSRDHRNREAARNPNCTSWSKSNEEFHLAIAAAAGNRRIFDQLKFMLEHVRRLDILGIQRDTGWVTHSEIMKALEGQNPMQARKAMARHIDDSRDRMLKLFGT